MASHPPKKSTPPSEKPKAPAAPKKPTELQEKCEFEIKAAEKSKDALFKAYAKHIEALLGQKPPKVDYAGALEQLEKAKKGMMRFENVADAKTFFEAQAKAGCKFVAVEHGPDGKPTGQFFFSDGKTAHQCKASPEVAEYLLKKADKILKNDELTKQIIAKIEAHAATPLTVADLKKIVTPTEGPALGSAPDSKQDEDEEALEAKPSGLPTSGV